MSRDWTVLLWSEKTWSERVQTVACFVAAVTIGLCMFGVGLCVLGDAVDAVSRYNSEKQRCLQNATNGLEIEQCKR